MTQVVKGVYLTCSWTPSFFSSFTTHFLVMFVAWAALTAKPMNIRQCQRVQSNVPGRATLEKCATR